MGNVRDDADTQPKGQNYYGDRVRDEDQWRWGGHGFPNKPDPKHAFERRIADLEQRMADKDMEIIKLLDAYRFIHRYYVNNVDGGDWPLKH